MLDIVLERLRQKSRTVAYPHAMPSLPARFRGRPFIEAGRCAATRGKECAHCHAVCPTKAITLEPEGPVLDMGLCTFCGACATACPKKALFFTTDWRLASTDRRALCIKALPLSAVTGKKALPLGVQSFPEVDPRRPLPPLSLPTLPVHPLPSGTAFKRSFRMRQVSAAGCGACEADLNVLGTIVFDIARFGMDFVASPRHADALVITGPAPRNMRDAIAHCNEATPEPRAVIAAGTCAISGGLFRELPHSPSPQSAEGAQPHLPVDLYIPGCPPHPYTYLDAFLRFLGVSVPGA